MKKILCVVLSVMMIVFSSLGVSAAAAPGDGFVSPQYDYMKDVDVTIAFDGNSGTAAATVIRVAGSTTLIEGTLTLYEMVGIDWVCIDSVSGSAEKELSLSIDFSGKSGIMYKALFEVTAYGASDSESASAVDRVKCP